MSALIPVKDLESFAQGLDHPEGICAAPDGYLYAGGEEGQLYRIDDGSVSELLRTGGFALGLAADADSLIYICDQVHHCVYQVDPRRRTKKVFSSGLPERPMRVPNWGAFGPDGSYYVSDSGAWDKSDGLIWRVTPDGNATMWCSAVTDFPNGLAVSADGTVLFILESTPPALVAVDIRSDGSAGDRRVVATLPDTVPDGVALTADGRFVIACYRPDSIYLVSEDGHVQLLATDPQGTALSAPTNVVFTGSDLDVMVVPNLGRWHLTRFRMAGLRGAPLFYPHIAEA